MILTIKDQGDYTLIPKPHLIKILVRISENNLGVGSISSTACLVCAAQHTVGFFSFTVLCDSNPENFDALVTGQVKKGYR